MSERITHQEVREVAHRLIESAIDEVWSAEEGDPAKIYDYSDQQESLPERDHLSPLEKDLVRLATPLEKFGTIAEAIKAIADVRQKQMKEFKWLGRPSSSDLYGSSFSDIWDMLTLVVELLDKYILLDNKKELPQESAAIIANLALWLVQATSAKSKNEDRVRKTDENMNIYGTRSGRWSGAHPNPSSASNTDGIHHYTEAQ